MVCLTVGVGVLQKGCTPEAVTSGVRTVHRGTVKPALADFLYANGGLAASPKYENRLSRRLWPGNMTGRRTNSK